LLQRISCCQETISLLDQLERSLAAIQDPDELDQQLMTGALGLRSSIKGES